ncbi:unnamed protein product [Heligmosomoides polygyrus]|uniref:Gag-pol polyprotein n=1 Tax=Heligmosomoides polygyrus TaxID=6339 RepID=A0A183FYK0_HELPZ|nr:unnamed protein product [Heligmosomoides polygyrus]
MKLSTLHDVAPSTSFLPKHTTATAANGTTIHLMAAVEIPMTIGRYTISHQLWLALDSDCPGQVQLGSNFIRQLNKTGLPISLDLHKHVIVIGEDHHNLVQVNHITIARHEQWHGHAFPKDNFHRSHQNTQVPTKRDHGCLNRGQPALVR